MYTYTWADVQSLSEPQLMCTHICIHMCVHICTFTNLYINTYTYVCISMYMFKSMCMYDELMCKVSIHIGSCICLHISFWHMRSCVCIHVCLMHIRWSKHDLSAQTHGGDQSQNIIGSKQDLMCIKQHDPRIFFDSDLLHEFYEPMCKDNSSFIGTSMHISSCICIYVYICVYIYVYLQIYKYVWWADVQRAVTWGYEKITENETFWCME